MIESGSQFRNDVESANAHERRNGNSVFNLVDLLAGIRIRIDDALPFPVIWDARNSLGDFLNVIVCASEEMAGAAKRNSHDQRT